MLKDKSFLEDLKLVEELDNQTSEAINGGQCDECRDDVVGFGEEACQMVENTCDPDTYIESLLGGPPENVLCFGSNSRNCLNNDIWLWDREDVVLIGSLCIGRSG